MATTTKARKPRERAAARRELSPVYAVIGVADYAVAALREVPGRVSELGDQVQKRVATLQKEASDLRYDAPDRVKEFGEKAQHYMSGLAEDAGTVYGGLVRRGELFVRRVGRQPEVVHFEEQTKAATAKVKAARTTARKGLEATQRSAKGVATTARKGAEATQRSTKAAVTSMTRAVEAAPAAVEGVAEVTGVQPATK